jgi:hypothetical protein
MHLSSHSLPDSIISSATLLSAHLFSAHHSLTFGAYHLRRAIPLRVRDARCRASSAQGTRFECFFSSTFLLQDIGSGVMALFSFGLRKFQTDPADHILAWEELWHTPFRSRVVRSRPAHKERWSDLPSLFPSHHLPALSPRLSLSLRRLKLVLPSVKIQDPASITNWNRCLFRSILPLRMRKITTRFFSNEQDTRLQVV